MIWYTVQQTDFFVILNHVLPFYPTNNPKNQNFQKIWKNAWDIIKLQMCTINDNDMMYGSWDMKHNIIFLILDNFLPFYPLATQKIKILKKWKKQHLEILSIYIINLNENHMMYGSWDMEHHRQDFFVILDPPPRPPPPLITQKTKILKKWKKGLEILPV